MLADMPSRQNPWNGLLSSSHISSPMTAKAVAISKGLSNTGVSASAINQDRTFGRSFFIISMYWNAPLLGLLIYWNSLILKECQYRQKKRASSPLVTLVLREEKAATSQRPR